MQAANLPGLPDPPPFPLESPLPKEIGQDHQTVEAGEVLRGIALFEIALHQGRRIAFGPFPPVPTVPVILLARDFLASILSWPQQDFVLP